MKKIKITVMVDEEKYEAIKMYMEQKKVSFPKEMENAIDAIYCKHVPQTVREFLKMRNEPKVATKESSSDSQQMAKAKDLKQESK